MKTNIEIVPDQLVSEDSEIDGQAVDEAQEIIVQTVEQTGTADAAPESDDNHPDLNAVPVERSSEPVEAKSPRFVKTRRALTALVTAGSLLYDGSLAVDQIQKVEQGRIAAQTDPRALTVVKADKAPDRSQDIALDERLTANQTMGGDRPSAAAIDTMVDYIHDLPEDEQQRLDDLLVAGYNGIDARQIREIRAGELPIKYAAQEAEWMLDKRNVAAGRQAVADLEAQSLGRPAAGAEMVEKRLQEIDQQVQDAYRASQERAQQMLLADGASLPPIGNGREFGARIDRPADDIDFSSVTGSETVQDDSASYNDGEDGTRTIVNLKQFGEVYAENGELKLWTVPDSGITPQAEASLKEIFDNNAPMINEAYRQGKINTIHLVRSENINGYHNGSSRDLKIILPDIVSRDAVDLLIAHEVAHALTVDAIMQASPDERKQLATACNSLRTIMYDDMEAQLAATPALIDRASDVTASQYKPVFQELKRIVADGDLAETLTTSPTEDKYGQISLSDCSSMNMDRVVNMLAVKLKIERPKGKQFSELLSTSSSYRELRQAWHEIETSRSIYEKLNEGPYVAGDNKDERRMGHSNDNERELAAPMLNMALNKPQLFTRAVSRMPLDEQSASLGALRITLKLASKNASPPFKHFLQQRYADMHNTVAGQNAAHR